jgi:hypothetical protein
VTEEGVRDVETHTGRRVGRSDGGFVTLVPPETRYLEYRGKI